LRRVAHVRITRRAQVERNVELGAAHRHVGISIGVGHALHAARADLLGELETAVHRSGGVMAGDHDDVLLSTQRVPQAEAFRANLRHVDSRGSVLDHGANAAEAVEVDQRLIA
jgi:hypothetical protein